METGQQIDAKVGKKHRHESHNGDPGNLLAVPAPHQAQMEQGGVDEPGNQGPGLLGVPGPVGAPGGIGPHGPGNDTDGQKKKPEHHHLVCQLIDEPQGG